MIRKIALGLLAFVVLLALIAGVAVAVTAPALPPGNSASLSWLQAGPYSVGQAERVWVDTSRPTGANRDFPGAEERTFPTTIWFPRDSAGPYPLIIHAHGFISSRDEVAYLLEHLASHGYVVVAADFPLTSGGAPGGPNVNDVSNQPADMAFLIDSVLTLSGTGTGKPFPGEIDPERIGIMGLSLGGLTVSLTTYHPRLRDPRVKAAISIAGPTVNLTGRFYEQSGVEIPFLMIGGTADRLIDYDTNAAVIPERASGSALLTITGGNHVGFVGLADPAFRLLHNADSLGCWAVQANIEQPEDELFADLLSEQDGIVPDVDAPPRCQQDPVPEAMHPGRQQLITRVGVLSFFESVFAGRAGRRHEAREVLTMHLARDFPEAGFRAANGEDWRE